MLQVLTSNVPWGRNDICVHAARRTSTFANRLLNANIETDHT